MTSTTYPLGPSSLPKGLTKLSFSYNFRAFLAILSIVLFFILYFSLVVGLGYLVYLAFTYEMIHINKLAILLKVGAIAGAAMLFVFTLKFIFKLTNPAIENRIKLDKAAHPELLNFVERICQESGAPRPRSIYVDPDVNAYVAYSNMWLSLIFPVRKDLTLGMGLISCLNLNEFKAVTAHEFGHFAQSSMKIGSYIMSANTIIHDMIFNRDKWDNLLEQWRGADLRLSAAAWAITPIIWLLRQILNLFYTFLNVMYSSLSREMEFNADKVAVSVSGSEAITAALWKLESGSQKWNDTLNMAYMAAQKELYTKNLYEHNHLALNRVMPEQKEALANLPIDDKGTKMYFSNSERSRVSMYASHPPNDHREENAKVPFVSCEPDERSPWILFSNPKVLQEEMTLLIYRQYLNLKPETFATIIAFEELVKAEGHGAALMAEYLDTFQNRYLYIPDHEEVNAASGRMDISKAGIAALKKELTELMKPVQEIEELMVIAQAIAEGTATESSFTFNGNTYDKKKINDGYDALVTQKESLFSEHFKMWDTSFCALHLALAREKGLEGDLRRLYDQHLTLNKVYMAIVAGRNFIYGAVDRLQQSSDVTEAEVRDLGLKVYAEVNVLNKEIAALDQLEFVPLPNLDTLEELKNAIIENGVFPKADGKIFENGAFDRISAAIEGAVAHCQRLDQKSIGAILAFHEDLIN